MRRPRIVKKKIKLETQTVEELLEDSREYFDFLSRELGEAFAQEAREQYIKQVSQRLRDSGAVEREVEVDMVQLSDSDTKT